MKMKTTGKAITAIADSGSPLSFQSEEVAETQYQLAKDATRKHIAEVDTAHNLAFFFTVEHIKSLGRLILPIQFVG